MTANALIAQITAPEAKEQYALALPAHVSADRFARILSTSVMADQKLMNASPESLIREATQIAALGLVTDPQLGEAWLIVDSKGNVQRRVGYRGLIKLAHQAGIPTIYAHDVCEKDEFEIVLGTEKSIKHKPNVKDRGAPYLYYAVMKDEAGNADFEYMTMAELDYIRDSKSDGWKAFKAGKIKSTPWSTDDGEMRKKTVLRRLLKRAPMSSDKAQALADALSAEDRADRGAGLKDVTGERGKVEINNLDDLVGSQTTDADFEEVDHDPDTGEVIEPGQDTNQDEAKHAASAKVTITGASGGTKAVPADKAIDVLLKQLRACANTDQAWSVINANQGVVAGLPGKDEFDAVAAEVVERLEQDETVPA